MLLLEMLNGSLELGGEAEVSRVSHIRQLVQRQQRVKTNGRRALSQELEDLLGNVLHKDPARRPADAGELLQLIRQLPEGAFAKVAAGGRAASCTAPRTRNSTSRSRWMASRHSGHWRACCSTRRLSSALSSPST